MPKIYICGPMSGLPNLNHDAFNAEAARLTALGFDVVNPADLNGTDMSWEACMRRDIAELVKCTSIHLLPGWQSSRGATLEYQIAVALGFDVTLAAGPEPVAVGSVTDWAAA